MLRQGSPGAPGAPGTTGPPGPHGDHGPPVSIRPALRETHIYVGPEIT